MVTAAPPAAVAELLSHFLDCVLPVDRGNTASMSDDVWQPKPATDHTAAMNAAHAAVLNLDDPGDWGRATRGLIATHETGAIEGPRSRAWDTSNYDFMRGEGSESAPASVHPSLWRQGRLNAIHGLFEVADGVWQARGYDISNITFLAGQNGWVIVDVLTAAETSRACLELANQTLGERPVSAVIYTHSHVDHFGGILGVTDQEAVDRGDVRVIAPEGFLHEAVSEAVIAGPAMARRAGYMFGPYLPPGPLGHVDSGLGKVTPIGVPGLIPPTEEVSTTGAELEVDGLRVVFQNTPGGEAPAEMNFLFPDHRLLCMAENCTHTMHNILTLRGALVRDSLQWSKYIQEAMELFLDHTDTLFSTHHWPRFGHDDAQQFLVKQRDVYRWLHDQTLRLANHGQTSMEIAEQLSLPACFGEQGHTREYYGTVSHNSKAIYQRHFGWFDGNPANLNPHPPEGAGRRYVEAMGGAEAVLDRAAAARADGDYRWAAQLLNHLVFADPANQAARTQQADTFEQLGYQSEAGPWRNFYLTGAKELRDPFRPKSGGGRAMLSKLTVEMIFDAIGVRLRADDVVGEAVTINWLFTDSGEKHALGIENCAINHVVGRHVENGDATLSLSKALLGQLMTGLTSYTEAIDAGDLIIDGDADAVKILFDNLDHFTGDFNICEP